jgi:hypothetical protein
VFSAAVSDSEFNISILVECTSNNIVHKCHVFCAYEVEPSVSVWFEELSYTTEESNTAVSVCVVASTTQRSFHVQIHPIPGTASGIYIPKYIFSSVHMIFIPLAADEDFSSQITSIGFGLGKDSKQCTHIIILQDYAVEDIEHFTALLKTPYENVNLLTAAANITIYPDDDRKICTFFITLNGSKILF